MQTKRLLPFLLLAFLLAGLPTPARAQITYTYADLEARMGQTFDASFYSATDLTGARALVDQKGANQTWDFTTMPFQSDGTGSQTYHVLPANLPGAAEAQAKGATFAIESQTNQDSTVWVYDKADAGAYYNIGYTYTVDGQTQSNYFDTPFLGLVFPLTYGTTWEGETTQTITAGGFSIVTNLQRDGEVDGWGTLVTPAGAELALRYKLTLVVGAAGFTTTTYVCAWSTLSGTSAGITTDASGNPIAATYSVVGGGPGGSAPATAPTPGSPANGARIAGRNVTLTWSSVDGAATYSIQISSSANFATIVHEQNGGTVTSYQVTLPTEAASKAEAETTYYWRVRAENESGEGPWSEAQSFVTVTSDVALERGADVPAAYALHAAFPNPFNPSTTFSFDLPAATPATLAVYDALGREVAVLVSGTLPAGRYTFDWDAADRPGGLYLYRLQAGAYHATRPVVLLK